MLSRAFLLSLMVLVCLLVSLLDLLLVLSIELSLDSLLDSLTSFSWTSSPCRHDTERSPMLPLSSEVNDPLCSVSAKMPTPKNLFLRCAAPTDLADIICHSNL